MMNENWQEKIPNFNLEKGNERILELTQNLGLKTYHELINFVWSLPYARVSDPNDHSLVLSEKRGVCSVKHALLAEVAHDHDHPEIEITVGYYLATFENSPIIEKMFPQQNLQFVEAHCYLKHHGEAFDFTTKNDPQMLINAKPYREETLLPSDIQEIKVQKHKDELKTWCDKNRRNFEEVWEQREKVIRGLAL